MPGLNQKFDDLKGDLVLGSADGLDSRVRSVKLRGVSDVFDSMLEAGADAGQDKTDEGLPLIELDDESEALGDFLTFALKPFAASSLLSLTAAKSILRLADKYQALLAAERVVYALLGHVEQDAATVFALAAIHGVLPIARFAIEFLKCHSSACKAFKSSYHNPFHPVHDLLLSIDIDLYMRIPHKAVRNYYTLVQSTFDGHPGNITVFEHWKSLAAGYTFE